MQQETVNIFIAYSRKDQEIKEKLKTALKVLQRVGHINSIWDDSAIEAGDDWQKAIGKALEQADIFLLLLSPDFIASDFCYETEMQKALEKHKNNEAVVVLLRMRACSLKNTPLEDLQVLPEDGKAIHRSNEQHILDELYLQITEKLQSISGSIRKQKEVNKIKKEFDKISKKAEDFYYAGNWHNAIKYYEQALKNYIENEKFLPSKEEIEDKVSDCNLNIDIAKKVLTLKDLLEAENYTSALKELQEITTLEEKRRLLKIRSIWGNGYCKLTVQIGDKVKKDDRLGVISNPEYKALGILPSPINGYIKRILFSEGQLIKNGQILFIIEKEIVKEQPKQESYRDNKFTYDL